MRLVSFTFCFSEAVVLERLGHFVPVADPRYLAMGA
jgi:hypothetical protein